LSAAALIGFALGLVLIPERAASKPQSANPPESRADELVPAYHAQAPQGALPATMNPNSSLSLSCKMRTPSPRRSRRRCNQQPCYCHCDRSQGHGSLLDCFASKHGAGCNICINEDFYSYEQSKKGKTAAQIRAGIIRGDWQSVDLTKYQQPLPAK